MTAYFISGLGADRRVFGRLKLPPNFIIRHIEWIEPLKNESLFEYSKRLSDQMPEKKDFILVGLSFGGLVAIEINKILPAKKIILISSISNKNELSLRYRLLNLLKLHKIIPAFVLKSPMTIIYWFFNAKQRAERKLLKYYVKNMSDNYLKWSINEVISWENPERPKNLYHIHGNADRIFLHNKTQADFTISHGGHMMVWDRAEEINRILTEILK